MARKARNGAGSSYEYKDRPKDAKTRWRHQRRVTLPDGTKKRIEGYGKSERAAVRDCEAKIEKLMDRASDSQTLGNFLEYYLELQETQVRTGVIKLASYANKRTAINKHIQGSALSPIPLNMLQPFHVQDWYNSLSEARSLSLANRTLRILKTVLNSAIDLGKLGKLPIPRSLKISENKPQISLWTAEECTRFLEVAKKHPLYPLFYLAIASGMRRGELLGLRWSCVDFQNGIVRVEKALLRVRGRDAKLAEATGTMQRLSGGLYLCEPKTKGSLRDIRIAEDAMTVLKQHREQQEPSRKEYDYNLVFRYQSGAPLSPDYLRDHYLKLQNEANVPHARIHDLRDMHASYLFAQNISAASISERLGHTDIKMTLNRYVHTTSPEREKAVMTLENMLDV